MKKIFILIFIAQSLTSIGQGCSDAGFCTMGAMKPDQNYSKKIDFKLRSVEFNYYHGKTLLSPVVHVYTADISLGINDYNAIQIKLPYQTVTGNLGNTAGMGDISLSYTRSIPINSRITSGISIGAKIPSGKSDIENTSDTPHGSPGGDLPMYYQVSLGTYDFIAGGSLITENWLFATGIQIPVIHQNENDFRWGEWPAYPNQENYLLKYDLANDLKRGTDIMLRAERNFRMLNYNFGLGALAIYRITKDEVYLFREDRRQKLDGTTGLAFNLLAHFGYNFNVSNSIRLIYGHKLADRDVNPDGLTRKHVYSASYIFRF